MIRLGRGEDFQDPREPPLRLGDIVVLNSGGPNMLVVDFDGASTVVAAWRAGRGAVREAVFPVICVHRNRYIV